MQVLDVMMTTKAAGTACDEQDWWKVSALQQLRDAGLGPAEGHDGLLSKGKANRTAGDGVLNA